MYHIFYIYSSVEGHLGSFPLLAIINKAAMNIVEHVTLLPVGTSSGGARESTQGAEGVCSPITRSEEHTSELQSQR